MTPEKMHRSQCKFTLNKRKLFVIALIVTVWTIKWISPSITKLVIQQFKFNSSSLQAKKKPIYRNFYRYSVRMEKQQL